MLEMYVEQRDKLATQLADAMDARNERLGDLLEKEAKQEFVEWSKLVDTLTTRIKAVKMVCYYCNTVMDPDNVNSGCEYNRSADNPPKDLRSFKNVPQEGFHGNGCHFFSQTNNIRVANLGKEQEEKMIEKKRIKLCSEFKVILQVLLERIRRTSEENQYNLPNFFEDFDKSGTGFVSRLHFERILDQKFGLEPSEMEMLRTFIDPFHHGEIDYGLFFRMTSEQNFFEKIRKS